MFAAYGGSGYNSGSSLRIKKSFSFGCKVENYVFPSDLSSTEDPLPYVGSRTTSETGVST